MTDEIIKQNTNAGPSVVASRRLDLSHFYGRAETIKQIHNLLKNLEVKQCSHLLLIRGETGSGKSSLVSQALLEQTKQSGMPIYYFSGTLDGGHQHHAFLQPVRKFLQEHPDSFDDVKVDTESRQVLSKRMPELKRRLNERSSDEYVGEEHSLAQALSSFLRALKQTLVFQWDGLHHATESDLNLLRSLVSSLWDTPVLFVLTGWCAGPNNTNTILDAFPQLAPSDDNTTEILFPNQTLQETNELVSGVLMRNEDSTQALSSFLYEHTAGSVFDVLDYLESWRKEGLLQWRNNQWHYDLNDIQGEFVPSLIKYRVSQLSDETRENIRVLSCLRPCWNPTILLHLVQPSLLNEAKGSLLCQDDESNWRFLHERVQETIYQELISDSERPGYHYRIGRKLWRMFSLKELDEHLFVVVDHLRMACSLMKDPKERTGVAKLCLHAGQQAVKLSSFRTAFQYFKDGIELLSDRRWREDYDLCLNLYSSAAETAYSSGYVGDIDRLTEEIIENSRSYEDTIRARTMKAYALGRSGNLREATELILEFVNNLGEVFPSKPNRIRVFVVLQKLRRRISSMSDESILRLPRMNDPRKLAIMTQLNLCSNYAFVTDFRLAALLCFRMVSLSLKYGISASSSMGFAGLATALCTIHSVREGARVGRLALAMYKSHPNKAFLARLYSLHYDSVHSWTEPYQDCIDPLMQGYHAGLETGDVEAGLVCGALGWGMALQCTKLQELDNVMRSFTFQTRYAGQHLELIVTSSQWQMVQNLMGEGEGELTELKGKVIKGEDEFVEELRRYGPFVHGISFFPRMVLCYLFGDFARSHSLSRQTRAFRELQFSPMFISLIMMIDSLAEIAIARTKKYRWVRHARQNSMRLRKWGRRAPYNFMCLHLLLDAELAALAGNPDAFSKYVFAIAMTKESDNLMFGAIANELAAKHLVQNQNPAEPAVSATDFFREALFQYRKWGALAKVQHLKNEIKGYNCDLRSLDIVSTPRSSGLLNDGVDQNIPVA